LRGFNIIALEERRYSATHSAAPPIPHATAFATAAD